MGSLHFANSPVRSRWRITNVIFCITLAGCGADHLTLTVAGKKLVVEDQGYTTRAGGYYCDALAPGQLRFRLVDFFPMCGSDPRVATARDPNKEHSELQFVLAIGANPAFNRPFDVGPVDCTTGPGRLGYATFVHFPAGTTMPDINMQAQSGSVTLSRYDPNNKTSAQGTFKLVFGGQEVSGSFDALTCD
jgi:hypothetical protein